MTTPNNSYRKFKLSNLSPNDSLPEHIKSEIQRLKTPFVEIPKGKLGDILDSNNECLKAESILKNLLPPEAHTVLEAHGKNHFRSGVMVEQYNLSQSHVSTTLDNIPLVKHMKKYSRAYAIATSILHDFYSHKENAIHKPSEVLRFIEDLCLDNNIQYPKDKEATSYKLIMAEALPAEIKGVETRGAVSKDYKGINKRNFKKNYSNLFK